MIYYEVWGWDTFAGEEYFCGRYTSRELAESVCKKKREDVAKTQDKGLRDTFSIVEISDKGGLKNESGKRKGLTSKGPKNGHTAKHTWFPASMNC